MRGTEGAQDFLTDFDLAVDGTARDQIISMVNWWLRENNTALPHEIATTGCARLAISGLGQSGSQHMH